jgi:hypothetical protein
VIIIKTIIYYVNKSISHQISCPDDLGAFGDQNDAKNQ